MTGNNIFDWSKLKIQKFCRFLTFGLILSGRIILCTEKTAGFFCNMGMTVIGLTGSFNSPNTLTRTH